MEKERWIEDVMISLQGIKRAEPNPFLFTRIEERIKSSAFRPNTIIPLPRLSLAFAGIAVLFVLNFFALKNSGKSNNLKGNTSQQYSLSNVNYQLY